MNDDDRKGDGVMVGIFVVLILLLLAGLFGGGVFYMHHTRMGRELLRAKQVELMARERAALEAERARQAENDARATLDAAHAESEAKKIAGEPDPPSAPSADRKHETEPGDASQSKTTSPNGRN